MSFGLLAVLLMAPVQLDPQGAHRPKIIVLDLVNGAELPMRRSRRSVMPSSPPCPERPSRCCRPRDLRKTVEVKASQSGLRSR